MHSVPARALVAAALVWIGATALPLGAAPASASTTITIALTAAGPQPPSVRAGIGDTITFINRDETFVHGAQAADSGWSFDTGPIVPGGIASTPALVAAGAYEFRGSGLDRFHGRVLVDPLPVRSAPTATSLTKTPAPPTATSDHPTAAPTHAEAAGSLARRRSPRRLGLPVALAVVGLAGVASLLWRVLLAHPAARRADFVVPRR